jgi:quinol-cytochrome oxidoreductase complex cytochrome b subunit
LYCLNPFRPSCHFTFHITTTTTQTSMPPVGFFFCLSGVFPHWSIFVVFNPFVLHVTLQSILPALQQTQHKHPCPRWDFFFVCPGFFPFDAFLYCLNPFVLHVTLRSILPSLQQTQHKHPCLRWDFFFWPVRGFSPLIHFCTV